MINENIAHKYCKDDIKKIENYDKAIADTTQTWVIHHRLELTIDGAFANSRKDLQRLGMYYNRPCFELIFMTKTEHRSLHAKENALSVSTRRKMSESNRGRSFSDEHRRKLSEAKKGKTLSAETRKKLSDSLKGRKFSEESLRKMSEAHKGRKLS